MELFALFALLVGLVIGAAATWLLARSRQVADVERARAEAERARGEAERLRAEQAQRQLRIAEEQNAIGDAQLQAAEALQAAADIRAELARAQAERDSAQAQLLALKEDTTWMTNQFQVLSTQALEKQGKQIDATTQQRMEATQASLQPMVQMLSDFQQRLTEVEKERAGLAAELRQQITHVTTTSEVLRRETHALTTALRKPTVRGAWGEQQLRRLAELAGMLEHCDFAVQATTVNATDAKIRPDMQVHFSDGKFIYVDSKVPLAAMLDAIEAADDAERGRHLGVFIDNVKTHIDQLSAKEYWRASTSSPELVVMFIPSDAVLVEALNQLPTLHEYAAQRQIVLASPSTLIAILKTVAYSWRQSALADNAAKVLELGRELFRRLKTMGTRFEKLGRAMDSSINAYNETMATLESRVMPQARKFIDLEVSSDDLSVLKQLETPRRPLTHADLLAGIAESEERKELLRQSPGTEELVGELVGDVVADQLPLSLRERRHA